MKTKREEITLAGKQLAEISLHMYKVWEEQMKAPVFAVIPFKEWLEKLIRASSPLDSIERDLW